MAIKGSKTYTFAEAVAVLQEGNDMAAIMEVTRYYPLLVAFLMPVVAKAGEELVKLTEHFPEHVTANKIDTALRGTIEDDEDGEDKPAKAKTKSTSSYERKTPQEGPYAGIKSMRLYKMAKDRGLEPEIRKPAAYYIEMLEADDAKSGGAKKPAKKAAKPVEPDDDVDDDEDDEDEAPVTKKAARKPAKKAPKPEPEDDEPAPPKKGAKAKKAADDDDDWDI